MKISTKKITGMDFLNLSLYAFAGLGMEVVLAYFIEPAIYGRDMSKWNSIQTILHWVLTCLVWGIISYLLIKFSSERYGFSIINRTDKIKTHQWVSVILCVIIVSIFDYITWGGLKLVLEFKNNGLVKFIFQYIYYLFETGLFMLIIIFGHKAFETWFGRSDIPYGGFVLALTWGLVHWFTKGNLLIGLSVALSSIIYGVVYLLLNRDLKWTYFTLVIMFVL